MQFKKTEHIVGITTDGRPVMCGRFLFDMRASKGFYLVMSIDYLYSFGLRVDFPGFIDRACECGWYEFQAYEAIKAAVVDAGLDVSLRDEIFLGCHAHIMQRIKEREALGRGAA